MQGTGWRCPSCNGENPAGTKFCGHCGTGASGVQPDLVGALKTFVTRQVADRLVEGGGRIAEERRLVTALFADISGFTALADRLDPEDLAAVIDPIITRLSSIVGRYEGYVDKFAGDALLALFGAPISREDDAARALLVAIDMHASLARLITDLPPHLRTLTLHVGVNSGHVIARTIGSDVRLDYAVLGDAVNVAQRLESAAPAGATYVGEETYALTRSRFDLEPVGELTFKGKPKPVPAWRLVGERATPATGIAGSAGSGMVGRQTERDIVTGLVDRLRAGTGGAIAVVGEPGVGKTTLTFAVRAYAEPLGIHWLDTRCLSHGAALPYWPYADLLRRLCGIQRDTAPEVARDRLRGQLQAAGDQGGEPFLAAILGLPDVDTGGLEPEAFRRATHQAIVSLLRVLSWRSPLFLAIEDIQWADASSGALTREIAQNMKDDRLLLYLTGRSEVQEEIQQIFESIAEPQRCTITLDALDETAVRSLVGNLLGGTVDGALVTLLAERTAGNPFFLEETIRSLRDTAVLIRRNGTWATAPGWEPSSVPPTIEGVIAARLDRLSLPHATTLQVASVVGRLVRMPLLRAVARDVPDVDGAVTSLVEGRFFDRRDNDPEQSFMFHHALTQQVAYDRLLRRRRVDLHRQVAEAAERLYGSGDDFIDLLARHLYLGDAREKAVDYLLRAAQRAQRLFANQEAILNLTRAAEVARAQASMRDRLPAIMLALARLQERCGDYEDALGLYTEVRGATSDVAAWSGIAGILRKQGKYAEALALIDQAFSALSHDSPDLRPLSLERAWSLSLSGHVGEAIETLKDSLTANPSRRDTVEAHLLLELARSETVNGRLAEAIEHGLMSQQIFEERADLPGLATALRIIGHTYTLSGRDGEAGMVLRRGLVMARRVGNSEEIGGCLINLGVVEMRRGELSEAIACDRQAIEEFERTGHGAGRASAYGNLADKLARAGEYEEAGRYCKKALDLALSIGHPLAVADTFSTMAMIYLGQGKFMEAAVQAETSANRFLDAGALPYAATAFTLAADALDKAGAQDRAAELRARYRSLIPEAARR